MALMALQRPANYAQLPGEVQWAIDKKLGILDWDGTGDPERGALRGIGKADIEFYESALVMTVAKSLAGKEWETLTPRSRRNCLDKALSALHAMLNDQHCVERLRKLSGRLITTP